MLLYLTPDELLATTRSVRKRLDLTRPVERQVLAECLGLAQQAPTASYAQNWHFVVVTDPQRRAALGELWRSVAGPYLERRAAAAAADERAARISAAVRYLADHIHQVPVHVIPCVEGRTDHAPVVVQASRWGSIIPAAWSFMLAARARGLGTVWTTFHLRHEREAAVLGRPDRARRAPRHSLMNPCSLSDDAASGNVMKHRPRSLGLHGHPPLPARLGRRGNRHGNQPRGE
jgi:nitroreductase